MNARKIKVLDMPAEERPREKVLQHGPGALSNAELIAVIIGSGISSAPVLNIAFRLAAIADNDMAKLHEMTINQLCKLKGIGPARAVALQAAMELGLRAGIFQHVQEDYVLTVNSIQIIAGTHPPGNPIPEASLPTFVPLPKGSKKRRLFDIGERSINLLATGNYAKVRLYQHAENAWADESPDRRI